MKDRLFCFLRHAEPLSEEGGLTSRGQDQAKSLKLPSFEAAFSSPAKRAIETASHIMGDVNITIIAELYLFDLSPPLAAEVANQIVSSPASTILVVAHMGIINQVAAILFPQFTKEIIEKRLGHAEGFLITKDSLTLVSPL